MKSAGRHLDQDLKPFSVAMKDMIPIWGAGLISVTLHEVGHTLGLRHNFKASKYLPFAKRADLAYIKEHGLASSVMDYLPENYPDPALVEGLSKTEKHDLVFMTNIGVYDELAIRYGYTKVDGAAQEAGFFIGILFCSFVNVV